jgi:hypothetical protein
LSPLCNRAGTTFAACRDVAWRSPRLLSPQP